MPTAPDATPAVPPAAEPERPADPAGPSPAPRGRPVDKVRIRFHKGGSLRLLSHHDLLRTFERLLRRSGLPFHRSQGFHPKPRLVFALSLPLGVVGREEVVELELGQVVPPEEVHERLARQAPPGLDILSVRRIDPSATAQVCRLSYAVPVPPDRLPDLAPRVPAVLAARECWVERNRPHSRQAPRRLDIRPFLDNLRIGHREETANEVRLQNAERRTEEGRSAFHSAFCIPHSDFLEMSLRLTAAGTARPEEVLGLVGLHDLLEAGCVLERTRLELHDEPPRPAPAGGGGFELEKVAHEKRDAD